MVFSCAAVRLCRITVSGLFGNLKLRVLVQLFLDLGLRVLAGF